MHVTVLKCLISGKYLMNNRADLRIALSAPLLRFNHRDSRQRRQDRCEAISERYIRIQQISGASPNPVGRGIGADAVDWQHSINRLDELD
jgi:hypothetical protein